MRINSTTVKLYSGSLLDSNVEAIVNAANREMKGGSGLNGLIRKNAGPGLDKILTETVLQPVEVGEPVVTGGFDLKQLFIIHVAGPIYYEYTEREAEKLLFKAYYNSLDKAKELKIESIGFPSISTGIYGFPLEKAAPVAFAAVKTWAEKNLFYKIKVEFWMFGIDEYFEFFSAIKAVKLSGFQKFTNAVFHRGKD